MKKNLSRMVVALVLAIPMVSVPLADAKESVAQQRWRKVHHVHAHHPGTKQRHYSRHDNQASADATAQQLRALGFIVEIIVEFLPF